MLTRSNHTNDTTAEQTIVATQAETIDIDQTHMTPAHEELLGQIIGQHPKNLFTNGPQTFDISEKDGNKKTVTVNLTHPCFFYKPKENPEKPNKRRLAIIDMNQVLGKGTYATVLVSPGKLMPQEDGRVTYKAATRAVRLEAINKNIKKKQYPGLSVDQIKKKIEDTYELERRVKKHSKIPTFAESGEETYALGLSQLIKGRELYADINDELANYNSTNHLTLSATTRLRRALSIALNIKALHDKNVVHRDIKPENIMLWDDADHTEVIDFQLSICAKKPWVNERVGTIEYVAPEVASKGTGGKESDIFSLAVVFFIYFRGSLIFMHNDNNLFCRPKSVIPLSTLFYGMTDLSRDHRSRFIQLLTLMFDKSENYKTKRPTIDQVVSTLQSIFNDRMQEASVRALRCGVQCKSEIEAVRMSDKRPFSIIETINLIILKIQTHLNAVEKIDEIIDDEGKKRIEPMLEDMPELVSAFVTELNIQAFVGAKTKSEILIKMDKMLIKFYSVFTKLSMMNQQLKDLRIIETMPDQELINLASTIKITVDACYQKIKSCTQPTIDDIVTLTTQLEQDIKKVKDDFTKLMEKMDSINADDKLDQNGVISLVSASPRR